MAPIMPAERRHVGLRETVSDRESTKAAAKGDRADLAWRYKLKSPLYHRVPQI